MIFSPYSERPRWLPVLKPSPRPTSRSREPTPQAMPNMVRKERSLCAQRGPKICVKTSITFCMGLIPTPSSQFSVLGCQFLTAGGLREDSGFVSGDRFRDLQLAGGLSYLG